MIGFRDRLSYDLWLWKTKSRIAASNNFPEPTGAIKKNMAKKGTIHLIPLYTYHIFYIIH